ncbi:CheR family methyltransferase [Pseudomonas sp.]|uniref:CheR family methyltransferase n=1 Tax=Pseudomonas sp. TaxID=306 RepID=UPI002736E509|nr:CheR family methyltransferase [Pseudomonas sp.]MDP3814680.1 CheR family methyltransferase [Pseudomonas sp.]
MPRIEPSCSPRLLQALVHKVHQHLGMDFSAGRSSELLRRLQLLALEQQSDEQQACDFTGWLQALAFADWDAALLQRLVPAFSVGETYFRRDADTFDWLAQHHLAALLARRRQSGQRSLRLWSAACCTGEEAYSLLFMLDELLGAERDSWTLELVASDINAAFLARAEQGVYGSNAFRSNEAAFRRRYFQAEGRFWRVRAAWRGRIRFIQYNLIDDQQACPLANADLILCRNVLMYFSPARATAVLKRLLGGLNDEGLLLLSAVEAGIATQAGLTGSWAGCNYALAKAGPAAAKPDVFVLPDRFVAPLPYPRAALNPAKPAVVVEPPAPPPTPPIPPSKPVESLGGAAENYWRQAQQALSASRYPEAREALLGYLTCAGLSRNQQHQACLLLARSWADQQHLEEAQDWLQRALQLQPDSAQAYWLQAQLAQQAGDQPEALLALQKALYLDPDFILGYFFQARLLAAQGRGQASDKALRVCRQLLAQHSADTPVPQADGMSCAQLLRLCEQLMQEALSCPSP